MYVQSFKNLIVWQRGVEVVKEIYTTIRAFPDFEAFGLTGQMRRAAVSIPANIAEGKKRKIKKDFLMFLRIADGSAAELDTLITIARDVYTKTDFSYAASVLTEIQKMLTTMINKIHSL